MNEPIGYIVGGGLKEGLRVRLTVPADEVQEGSFLVCDSGRWRYFGLVTDLQLGATDPRFADEQTDRIQPATSTLASGGGAGVGSGSSHTTPGVGTASHTTPPVCSSSQTTPGAPMLGFQP